MKTNKLKKILSIVIVSIIIAIALVTVILAIVPKKLYNPISKGYYTISVYKNKESNIYPLGENPTDEAKAVDEKIYKLIEDSVKDNLLSAIFQGTSKFEVKVKSSNEGNVMNSVANVDNAVCLIFNYLDEQTLKLNGETYINSQATTADKTVKYNKIFMPISNTVDFNECTVYLTDSDNKSSYQIQFLAHQSEIYSYISSLTWNNAE